MTSKKESRSVRRAKLLREGLSWRQACLRSGYSVSAANRGPKSYFEGSPGVRREFARLAEDEPYSPTMTRKIAKNRLAKAVLEGKPSNVAREVELLGRFKEHDWWIRSAETQVGIFASFCDAEMDDTAKSLDAYREMEDASSQFGKLGVKQSE
jgi:hypothetical protein